MNSSSFNSCYNSNCSAPYGSCTSVNNGSAYDQFDKFRSVQYAPTLSQQFGVSCTFVDNPYFVYNYITLAPNLFQRFMCSSVPSATLVFNLRLNATAYAFAYGYPHANLTTASLNQSSNGNATVGIGIQNIGPVSGNFSIGLNNCCYSNATGSFCQNSSAMPFSMTSYNLTVPSSGIGALAATLGK